MGDGTTIREDPPPPAKRRFQFSLLQLLMAVLSIGGCVTAWHLGWSSFSLPIILGWLWWFAFAMRTWFGRLLFCLVLPAVTCLVMFVHMIDNEFQSTVQRALPGEYWVMHCGLDLKAELEKHFAMQRGEAVAEPLIPPRWHYISFGWRGYPIRCLVGVGVLLPFILFAGGYAVTRLRHIRNRRAGWCGVGVGLGALLVSLVVGYALTRAAIRKAGLRANWPPDEIAFYEGRCDPYDHACMGLRGRHQITLRVSDKDPDNVRIVEHWGWRGRPTSFELWLPPEDFEELWNLLESNDVFYLVSDESCACQIDGEYWNLEVTAGQERMNINTGCSYEFGLPLMLFRDHLLRWLEQKGFPEPSRHLKTYFSDEEHARIARQYPGLCRHCTAIGR